MNTVFPDAEWTTISPEEAGMDPELLAQAEAELANADVESDPRYIEANDGTNPYRVVVARYGRIVAEWNNDKAPSTEAPLASATKSIFSNILGIAASEAMIPSVDSKLTEHFPEALDVLPGEGPKEGRYARHKDRDITLRQLIANTSGYLKPDEQPGEIKHYQTFGMNVLSHALASTYGMYDPNDPEGSPGIALLIDTRLRIPLCGSWGYEVSNFDHPAHARAELFGYFTAVTATARDMARLGLLWSQFGRWKNQQLVPTSWMREAVTPAPADGEADPERNMLDTYGLGFWTNARGACWPSLPEDSFAALGAGGIVIWVSPANDLVVVEGPGPFYHNDMNESLFPRIVESIVD